MSSRRDVRARVERDDGLSCVQYCFQAYTRLKPLRSLAGDRRATTGQDALFTTERAHHRLGGVTTRAIGGLATRRSRGIGGTGAGQGDAMTMRIDDVRLNPRGITTVACETTMIFDADGETTILMTSRGGVGEMLTRTPLGAVATMMTARRRARLASHAEAAFLLCLRLEPLLAWPAQKVTLSQLRHRWASCPSFRTPRVNRGASSLWETRRQ